MAVKLKLKRVGRTHCPHYRLTVMDSRTRRDGRALEELGTYDPDNEDPGAQVRFNLERVRHWLSRGARPTDTVRHLLRRQGILTR